MLANCASLDLPISPESASPQSLDISHALRCFGFVPILLQKSQMAGANFPAVKKSDRRPVIRVPSIALPRSSASLSSCDEVPHIFTRKSRLKPGKFLITSAKGLLQQNRHQAAVSHLHRYVRCWWELTLVPRWRLPGLTSRAEEFRLRALPEPYVNLSIHTAP